MKILQLVTRRQYRGAEVFAANLSKELLLLGHEIIFVGLYKNNTDVLVVQGAIQKDLADSPKTFSFKLIKDLISFIKSERPDVIQCNGSDTLKYMVAASFFIPKIPVTYRNISIISVWLKGSVKKRIYQNMFKRIDHVTSVGIEAANDFATALNYPKNRITIIRRGIPLKHVGKSNSFKRGQFGIGANEKIAVHVGNFSPEKNHEFLLEVFSEIKNSNSNIKLILIGNGVLLEHIKQRVSELKLQGTIFIAGFRKDIPEILAQADCLLLSSKVEGVPGVILEAAAQKVPAVATNVGGVKEVLKDGETGFLINDFDVEMFRQKIISVMTNDALRSKLGSNAYNMVTKKFNPVKNAKKFEDLYTSLVQQSK